MTNAMQIRPARPDDPAVDLLYQSALPYYDAYAGGSRRARAMLEAVFPKRGHTASFECCRVALAGDEIVGLIAGFPVPEGDQLARRFVRLTVPRLPVDKRHNSKIDRSHVGTWASSVLAGGRMRGL